MSSSHSNITYLSDPSSVSMADDWFDVAKPEHFWVKRRFEVFRQLARQLDLDFQKLKVAEIGCGHGLVQYQFKKYYGIDVDGFDLNEVALQKSIATDQNLFLYDIHQRNPEYKNHYDLIILFDVIEHIEDQFQFIESSLYHLKKGGILAINVPALKVLYSKYDVVQGHYRRYNSYDLDLLEKELYLSSLFKTYWGLPLIPLLLLRKFLLNFSTSNKEAVSSGFKPPSKMSNNFLYFLSQIEFIPQLLGGTSFMVFYKFRK